MDFVIAGSGPELPKEFLTACERLPHATIIGVNNTAFFLPRADYLCSLHVVELGPMRAMWVHRDWNKQGGKPLPVTVGPTPFDGVDLVWKPEQGITGTSALYAVRVALHLGAARVLLAGVPMDGSGRFYDHLIPGGAPITWPHEVDRGPWEDAQINEFQGRVRSLSGWTASLLGEDW